VLIPFLAHFRFQADPGQLKTIGVGALAGGASQSFGEQLGPNGNCYDPDCTVRVTVDSTNAIQESNETNNVATRTDPG
jgi:subtilase family serine protease